MAATPLVHANQLRIAREVVSLPLDIAAAQLQVPVTKLQAWESGAIEPSIEDLESLARLYGRDVSYFLGDFPRRPEQVFLRTSTHRRIPQFDLETRKVLAQFEELCRFEWELERLQGLSHDVRFSRQTGRLSAEELSTLQRDRLGLDSKPVRSLRDLLEGEGVRTFWLPLNNGGLSGLSWWNEVYGPCMLVNLKDAPGRRNFTMAHTFAHLLVDANESFTVCDLSDIEPERFANRFAAVFLMPELDLRRYWTDHLGKEDEIDIRALGSTATRYGVSLEALAIRLEELGLLPNATSLLERLPQIKTYGRGRPGWRRIRGETFTRTALSAYQAQRLSVGKLADYLGVDLRTALRLATEAETSHQ